MKPFEVLPHRHPFIMPDSVEIIEEGRKARGIKLLTCNDPVLMPDSTLPEAYLVETMAQISGVATGRKGGSMLAAVNRMIFSGRACAGDILEIVSVVERALGQVCIFSCSAVVSGKTIAEGEVILHFSDAP